MRGAKPENLPAPATAFRAATNESRKRTKRQRTPSPRVTLRLTADENDRLKHLAEGQPVSAYIRSCLFGEKTARRKRKTYLPVKDQEAMARALALLGKSRVANNLNQLAHHANIGTLPVDDETRAQIEETCAHIRAMRDALVAALGLIDGSAQ